MFPAIWVSIKLIAILLIGEKTRKEFENRTKSVKVFYVRYIYIYNLYILSTSESTYQYTSLALI